MGDLYLVCNSADLGPAGAGTVAGCSNPHWVAAPQLLPQLSAADGVLLGTAIVGCWAIAWAYRQARKAL